MKAAAVVFLLLTIVFMTNLTRGLIVVEAKKPAFAIMVAALIGALDGGRISVGRVMA